MKPLSSRELEAFFIEFCHINCDDEVNIFGEKYSKINLLRDADPTHFRIALNEYLDNEVQNKYLFEVDGEYYDEKPKRKAKKVA